MAEQLESKFEKFKGEINNNLGKWIARLAFEPGYALRNVLAIGEDAKKNSKVKNDLPSLYAETICLEILRLGGYGLLAYTLTEQLIK